MSSTPYELPFVADAGALSELVERLGDAPLVSIDTEFVRERTYFPELCVLQVASNEVIAAVDCIADLDLDPLIEALLAPNRNWVLHSARQDMEVLAHRCGRLPTRIIDTQLAAALLGYPLQIGLQGLLAEVLGISIDKEHTRADWSRRPLADAVLRYALDDVRYLLPAWQELSQRLSEAGRLSWFHEDCRRLLDTPIQPDATAILERTRGGAGLRGKKRAAALALIEWREDRAVRRDKPRRWILADEQLMSIATALPQTPDDLARIEGLPPNLVTRSAAAIIAAVRDAEPGVDPPDRPAPDKAVVKCLQEEVRDIAEGLKLQPELLATRKDIALAASGHPGDAFTSGWRGAALAPLVERLTAARGC